MNPTPPAADSPQPAKALDAARGANWARRTRRGARLSALLTAAAAFWLGGADWFSGAFWGGLAVEVNLSLLAAFLERAALRPEGGLFISLAWFYLAFAATAAFCFLVVSRHWGHPLAFLMGLASFSAGAFSAIPHKKGHEL